MEALIGIGVSLQAERVAQGVHMTDDKGPVPVPEYVRARSVRAQNGLPVGGYGHAREQDGKMQELE